MHLRAYHRQALGAIEEGFCLRAAQQWLYDRRYLPYQFVSGTMNAETGRVLTQLLGPGWEQMPGGACGLIGVLEARISAGQYFSPGGAFPGQFPGGFPGQYPISYPGFSTASMFGNIDPMALLVGAGVLGLVLLLKR